MNQLERIGVSLESDLLKEFDDLITQKGYGNRSEAIRDLIREKISQEKLAKPKTNAIAAIVLVYDHHIAHISRIFRSVHHESTLQTVSCTHVYVDSHNCMDILIVKGKAGDIQAMGEKMISHRGVKLGRINIIAV